MDNPSSPDFIRKGARPVPCLQCSCVRSPVDALAVRQVISRATNIGLLLPSLIDRHRRRLFSSITYAPANLLNVKTERSNPIVGP